MALNRCRENTVNVEIAAVSDTTNKNTNLSIFLSKLQTTTFYFLFYFEHKC